MTLITTLPALRPIVFLLLLWVSAGHAADQGLPVTLKKLLLSEQYSVLNKKLRPLAKSGHAGAQYQLGLNYQKGRGLKADSTKALYWFDVASKQNHSKAQFSAALLLLNQQAEKHRALAYLKKAAGNGHVMAKRKLKQLRDGGLSQTTGDSHKQLFYAAQHEVLDQLRRALQSGVEPNIKNGAGQTALQLAIENGHSPVVKQLLASGAQIGSIDALGNTALHYAVRADVTEILRRLLSNSKASLNSRNQKGDTALSLAVMLDHYDAAKWLLSAGANPQLEGREGRVPFDIAAAKKRTRLQLLLEEHGAHSAASENSARFKEGYAALKLQLQEPVYEGWDALMLAAWSGDPEMVAWLLQQKAQWQVADALRLSLEQKYADIAVTLSRARLKQRPGMERLLPHLQQALAFDGLEPFQVLAGAVDDKTVNGLLWQASRSGAEKVSMYLLERGADSNTLGEDGSSCLQHTAASGSAMLVKRLISSGADVDLRDPKGRSALWYAIDKGELMTSQLLLGAGAEVNFQDEQGHSPLIRAVIRDDFPAAELLFAFGADPGADTSNGNTALVAAAEKASAQLVNLLLKRGSDVSQRNGNSLTALMVAVQRGDKAIVQLLLEAGADPSRRSRAGKSSLDISSGSTMTALLQRYD